MSVSTNQYLLLGVKLPYQGEDFSKLTEEYEDNGYKDEIKHKNGLVVITDGMSGEYCFVGRLLEKSVINTMLNGPVLFREPTFIEAGAMYELIRETFPMLEFGSDSIATWFFTHYH
jgi:hypothetical protein